MSDEGSRASNLSLSNRLRCHADDLQEERGDGLAFIADIREAARILAIVEAGKRADETAALRCGCGANKWRCDNCDGLPVETCGDVSGEMTCKLPKGHRAMHQDCHPRTGEYLTWSSEKTTRELVMLSAQVERRLGRSGGFFLYHGEVIDVGGQQPEQVPPGMIYCDELDRWMPKDWVSDTSTENQL